MFTMAQRGHKEGRKHRDTTVSTCFGAYFKLSANSKLEKAPKCRLPPPPALHSKVLFGLNTQAPTARLPGLPAICSHRSSKVVSLSLGSPGGLTMVPGWGRPLASKSRHVSSLLCFLGRGRHRLRASKHRHCLSTGLVPRGPGPSTRLCDSSLSSVPSPPSDPPAQGGQKQLRNEPKVWVTVRPHTCTQAGAAR